jgi:hypothetical protein
MPSPTPAFSRRTLLAAAAAAAVPAALPARTDRKTARAGRRVPFDATNPASFLRGFRRTLFAAHQDLVFWWMKGTRYGIVDNVTTPWFGMEVATILRCHDEGPENFSVTSLELVYNTDLATGELLERWQNPYTSEWLDLKYVPVGPTRIPYTTAGPELPRELPGAQIESTHVMGPATIVDDDLWIRNDTNAVVTRVDAPGPPFRVHDWATYHAQLHEIEDESIMCPAADVSFIDLTGWPRSMKMGDRPGTRMSRCAGRKVAARDALPQSFLALLERVHPAIYRDPAGALVAPANRFER